MPDLPGGHGCGLYEPDKIYNINPKGALCKNVCNAYEKGTSGTGSNQVGYSCDATLCTTLGIGQENNPDFSPSQKAQAGLLKEACSGMQDINGMKQIMCWLKHWQNAVAVPVKYVGAIRSIRRRIKRSTT